MRSPRARRHQEDGRAAPSVWGRGFVNDAIQLVIVATFGVATFFTAAKTHGRQVRLEREAAGFHHVVFGGDNPADVEAIWARDRHLYWAVAGAASAVGVVAVLLATFGYVPRLVGSGAAAGWAWFLDGLLSILGLPMVLAFMIAGATSFARTRRDHPALRPPGGTATWGWWVLTLAFVVALLAAWALSLA